MQTVEILFILTVVVVFIFDFTNGFHDAADMIATAIASKEIKTDIAVAIVGVFTFLGPIVAGVAVADTIGTFVDISGLDNTKAQITVISSLLAAVSYNLATWKFGLPSSSSNSLAGGLVGAGLFMVGSGHINWGLEALKEWHLEGLTKVFAGLFLSPFFGFIVGFIVIRLIIYIFKRFTMKIKPLFIATQYFTIAFLGFSHGANDAQKGMAIIAMMLLASGYTTSFEVPFWVILLCTSAITLGTVFGGWSIIKTLGFELYPIKLIDSVANQLSSAIINSFATHIGAPTSTTQVVTASLLGVGAAQKPRHVGWSRAFEIVIGWVVNVPISMLLGAIYCFILTGVLK